MPADPASDSVPSLLCKRAPSSALPPSRQFSCDFALAMDEVTLSHSGGSEVHLTGYRVEQMIAESDGEEGYGFGAQRRAVWVAVAQAGDIGAAG